MQLLSFEHGRESFCIRIDEVSEVLRDANVTALPRAPGEFEGIFQLRGRPVTLLNFQRCFFPKSSRPEGECGIVVLAEPRQHFAIRITGAIESRDLECDQLEVPPGDEPVGAVLQGVIKDDQAGIFHLLSAEKIFLHARKLITEKGGE